MAHKFVRTHDNEDPAQMVVEMTDNSTECLALISAIIGLPIPPLPTQVN